MPEISDDELKQFTALKESEAKAKTDKEAADKVAADKAKADKEAADKDKNKGGQSDDDLREKVRKEKEAAGSKAGEIKTIEKALAFNMSVEKFVSDNADALPSEIPDLLKAAEKEKYDSAAEKASAIRAAFVQSFFSVESHVELLTASQKTTLDDYLKLTKNGKQDKASEVYENLFEPALETLKKVRKAEELGKARSGFASSSKVEDGYKQRLMARWNRK